MTLALAATSFFLFSGLELELSRQKSSFILYLRPLRPPIHPDPHARTHTMHNAHHIHDLSPPRLAIGPSRPKPYKDARATFVLFSFCVNRIGYCFFLSSAGDWSLLTPSPVPPSAHPLARSHVYPYLPGPSRPPACLHSLTTCTHSYNTGWPSHVVCAVRHTPNRPQHVFFFLPPALSLARSVLRHIFICQSHCIHSYICLCLSVFPFLCFFSRLS